MITAAFLLRLPVEAQATVYFWDGDGSGVTLDYGSGTVGPSVADWWLATSGSTGNYNGWTNSTSDTMQIGSASAQSGKSYAGGSTAPAFTLTLGGATSLWQIVVSSTYGGNLTLTMATTITSGTCNLFDGLGAQGSGISESGDFSSGTFAGGAYAGVFSESSGIWSATDTNGSGQQFSFDLSTGDLTVVPEPGTFALCGLGLIALMIFRKRPSTSRRK